MQEESTEELKTCEKQKMTNMGASFPLEPMTDIVNQSQHTLQLSLKYTTDGLLRQHYRQLELISWSWFKG